jgi:hypothetical protein
LQQDRGKDEDLKAENFGSEAKNRAELRFYTGEGNRVSK